MPNWFDIAGTYLGTKEVVGAGSNPKIMQMASRLGGWLQSFYKDDDIPWCALFVNNCLAEAGLKGTRSLAARSFETWGVPMLEPSLGAVLVFVRPGGGHVGFYVGQRVDGALRVRGGNQGNAVSEVWIEAKRLTAIRWPLEVPLPTSGRVILQGDGMPTSTNEG